MKLTIKNSTLLFLTGVGIQFICAIPAIFNHDNRLLTPGLIVSSFFFLLAVIGLIKWITEKK